MTSIIQWEKQAQADREAIFRYLYQQAGLSIASATDDRFISMVNILQDNPLAGTKTGKTEKQRKLVVPHFPFIIVHLVESDAVRVLRVLHTSRKIAGRYNCMFRPNPTIDYGFNRSPISVLSDH